MKRKAIIEDEWAVKGTYDEPFLIYLEVYDLGGGGAAHDCPADPPDYEVTEVIYERELDDGSYEHEKSSLETYLSVAELSETEFDYKLAEHVKELVEEYLADENFDDSYTTRGGYRI